MSKPRSKARAAARLAAVQALYQMDMESIGLARCCPNSTRTGWEPKLKTRNMQRPISTFSTIWSQVSMPGAKRLTH
jgi:transcription termination factor NusB